MECLEPRFEWLEPRRERPESGTGSLQLRNERLAKRLSRADTMAENRPKRAEDSAANAIVHAL